MMHSERQSSIGWNLSIGESETKSSAVAHSPSRKIMNSLNFKTCFFKLSGVRQFVPYIPYGVIINTRNERLD